MTPRVLRSPVIEGDRATFWWYGDRQPLLIGDFTYWGMDRPPVPFESAGEDGWRVMLTFPRDAYLEYRLIVDGQSIPDPLNPLQRDDGLGGLNSVFRMPDAVATPLSTPDPQGMHGTLTSHTVDGRWYVFDSARTVHLYQPPTRDPVPLLVVFDGSGYVQQAHLPVIVDNLIVQGRIRPLALALVDPSGRGRLPEYACSDTTLAFLITCLLPMARQHLTLIDIEQTPGAYGIMGASMGGLMSLYAGLRAPQIFGSVLSQSGAFHGDHLFYRSVIHDLVRYLPRPGLRVWMDCGIHEWYLMPNREMAALLSERGYDVSYSEHTSGHNYPSWQNHLPGGLEFLFGR